MKVIRCFFLQYSFPIKKLNFLSKKNKKKKIKKLVFFCENRESSVLDFAFQQGNEKLKGRVLLRGLDVLFEEHGLVRNIMISGLFDVSFPDLF